MRFKNITRERWKVKKKEKGGPTCLQSASVLAAGCQIAGP